MNEPTYSIVFEGKIASGHDLATVKKRLGESLKLEGAALELLFDGRPTRKKDSAKR